jgi:sugar/nucleoside kinase (ribokinase family)
MKRPMKFKSSRDAAAGVMAVGKFVVDYHKLVDHYPMEQFGAQVLTEQVGNGGAALNVLVNLAKLQLGLPLYAAAQVGQDLDGKWILDCCEEHGIDVSQVTAVEGASTGYTDVYTTRSSGRHTCFYYSGIGDALSRKDVRLRAVQPKLLFVGGLGTLGKLDQFHQEYGRRGVSQLIRDARKYGITTVVEIAAVDSGAKLEDFAETLAEADYLIINDRLTELLLRMELYTEHSFDAELVQRAGEQWCAMGLRKGVVIQSGAAAAFISADGCFDLQHGYHLPLTQRVGSAGVDHAFCAGFLAGLSQELTMDQCLKQALAVATVCRRDLTSSGGLLPLSECLELCEALAPTAV